MLIENDQEGREWLNASDVGVPFKSTAGDECASHWWKRGSAPFVGRI